jgi:hypothetical protein
MTWGSIPNGDRLFRHAFYPLCFKTKQRLFAWQNLIYFKKQHDGSLLGSLAWERYVPTEKYVHEYGCRLARGRNDKKRAEGRFADENRDIYCGAYQLRADAVRALVTDDKLDEISSNEILSVDVVHHIEAGEIARTDSKVLLKPKVTNIAFTKTAILVGLWNACSGPLRHTCDSDLNVNPHPNINLITAPAGECSYTRPYFNRLWYLVRFQARYWFWRVFCERCVHAGAPT